MPLIEEIPIATVAARTHGWAYVPDTGPVKSTLRTPAAKRGAGRDGVNRGDISAKQAKQIQARLDALDRENHRDVAVPVPSRTRTTKITPNVRRILQYSRTFAHYLAEEEAQATTAGPAIGATPTALHREGTQRQRPGRKATQPAAAMPPPPTPVKQETKNFARC